MTDITKAPPKTNTEEKLVEMISDGRIKAKIDKKTDSIMFDIQGESVEVMVDKLQDQTLKIIRSIGCLEEADIELIKLRKESLFDRS